MKAKPHHHRRRDRALDWFIGGYVGISGAFLMWPGMQSVRMSQEEEVFVGALLVALAVVRLGALAVNGYFGRGWSALVRVVTSVLAQVWWALALYLNVQASLRLGFVTGSVSLCLAMLVAEGFCAWRAGLDFRSMRPAGNGP